MIVSTANVLMLVYACANVTTYTTTWITRQWDEHDTLTDSMLDCNWLDHDDNFYGNTIGTRLTVTGILMTPPNSWWLNGYSLWWLMGISLGGGEVYSFGISFDGRYNRSRHGFGFDTMALMVMLHHYLAGTFGSSICWFDYDFMVDYDLMTWIQRLGSISDDLVWQLWFNYIDSMTMMTFTIMMHILTNNTLMPRFNSLRLASTGFTSRIDIFRWLSPSGLCFTSHGEDVFITSWIFSNSQLTGTEWILT
jgi:hypothetical protein